jgi:hypothetical protein
MVLLYNYHCTLATPERGHAALRRGQARRYGSMVNTEITVKLESGKEVLKRFSAGTVVRVNDEEGKPLSFDLVINKGPNHEPEFLNRISVSQDAKFRDLVKQFKKGQQLFCEINVQISDKTDNEGKPYRNLWLQSFDYGKNPRTDEEKAAAAAAAGE